VGREWAVRLGSGEGGEMTQTMYAHMNKIKVKKKLMCLNLKSDKGIQTFIETVYIYI
jgi:hypothetical protein